VDTVVFHLDALTREDARNVLRSGDILQGLDIISGPLLETFLFHKEEKAVILIDEFLQVRLWFIFHLYIN
jgi:ER membrane protein complex subunit 1